MNSGEKLQTNLLSEKDQPNWLYLLHSVVSVIQISSNKIWRIFVKDTVRVWFDCFDTIAMVF